MCKCTYTVVVALQSFIALTAIRSILAPPTPPPALHLYFFLPVQGIGKAVHHVHIAQKFRKCYIITLPTEPGMRPGRVISDMHYNLCINFVLRQVKT